MSGARKDFRICEVFEPESLYKYWMAYADKSISDLHDKIKEDDAFRLEEAERCGIGFELPSVVPNVQKTKEPETLPVAA
jgi:hypothetical protein